MCYSDSYSDSEHGTDLNSDPNCDSCSDPDCVIFSDSDSDSDSNFLQCPIECREAPLLYVQGKLRRKWL